MTILSTIVPDDVSAADVAALLDRAASLYEARLVVFVAGEQPVTLFGAVRVAGFGDDRWPTRPHHAADLVRAAEVALKEHLGTGDLDAWSETATHDEALTALRDTAAGLRGGA